MSPARQLIDSEADDFQFTQDIRQRQRQVRLNEPRKARKGDVVKVYSRMKAGEEIRVGQLFANTVDVVSKTGKPATEFFVQYTFGWDDYAKEGETVHSTGSGSFIWLHEPGEWGVQRVEIVSLKFP